MNKLPASNRSAIYIEHIETLAPRDLSDLADATDAAICADGGFGWTSAPALDILERYWQGVVIIPERLLLVGRLDGTIAAAVQLVLPSRHNEAQAHLAQLISLFVAPWARGHGLGKLLIETAEATARDLDYGVLQVDIRETQTAAINLYEKMGFKRWGSNPHYARVDGHMIAGHFYSKIIDPKLMGLET